MCKKCDIHYHNFDDHKVDNNKINNFFNNNNNKRKNKRKSDNNNNENNKKFKFNDLKFKSKFKNFNISKIYNNCARINLNISNLNCFNSYIIKHIIHNRNKFFDYQSFKTFYIVKKYDKTLLIIIINIIHIEIKKINDQIVTLNLKNVLYIFNNKFNLIFIKALFKNNYFIKFSFNEIKIERNEMQVI